MSLARSFLLQSKQGEAPKVVVVIVNFNGRELLRRCLESIERNTTYPNFEVIVVDNGSTDGSIEMVKSRFPEVLLITNSQNLGYAKACNQGARLGLKRGADYVIFLENDTEVLSKRWIEKLLKAVHREEKIGLVAPRVKGICEGILLNPLRPSLPLVLGGYKPPPFLSHTTEVEFVFGVALLVSKKLIDTIGLLDELFSPFVGEDLDYCMRAKKAGFKIIFTPEVVINHRGSTTTKKLETKNPNLVYFVGVSNFLIFIKRHFSFSRFIWEILWVYINLLLDATVKKNVNSLSRIPWVVKAIGRALSVS